ncbi:MAG: hydroxyisourate hydrolase [Gemmatimonadales bacterium]
MSAITTHVLDVSRGVPAAGIEVTLARADTAGHFTTVGRATTDADGRVRSFGSASGSGPGRYRLTFRTAQYFTALGVECFFPEVQLQFELKRTEKAQHVPLLLAPFGYSTYRGS